jgi:CxxC-x17-CxxC domain-containing protein
MGDFNRDRSQSRGRNFGRRDFGGDRLMHQVICSKCNKECEVPFKPAGIRPVFCKDCFQNNRASVPTRFDNNYPISRPVLPQHKEQFEALNIKLDKILRILEPKIVEVKKTAKKSTSVKKK